ncbi:Mitochondrial ATPase complex subunit atp10 [Ceratobasidium sp. 395]|nr:Mitochondrial ATPase complex subunit atp10 [Ceratobasidium sp. 395]
MQSLALRARTASLLRATVLSRPQIRYFKSTITLRGHTTGSPTSPASASKQPPNAQAAKSAVAENPPDEGLPLSFLSRPLGVADIPSAKPKTWSKAREELLDRDKHLEKRRHLVKEVTRGYFHDFHKLKHHGGKMWIAPRVLIREDKALYFPDVTGITLGNRSTIHTTTACSGRITLLSVLSTKISELHAQSFIETALKQHKDAGNFQYMQINLQENLLKSWLVSLFLSGLRKQVPEEFQSTYILSHQNMEFLRVPLGMENKHIGYTYLIDENLKVRWAGCGFARPEETEGLANCTRILLERLDSPPTPVQQPKPPTA